MAAIDNFDGAVIMVTHNEMFLHALADRLIVFDDVGAYMFDGSYQEFLEKAAGGTPAMTRPQVIRRSIDHPTLPVSRKRNSGACDRKSSPKSQTCLKPMEDAIAAAENSIEKNEALLDRLNREMVEASEQGDGARIGPLSQKIRTCQEIIETRFADMEQMDEQRQRLEKKFERRLAGLEA